MLKVQVQSTALRDLPFKDRDGNPLQEQTCWATFYDREGNLDLHPRTIAVRMSPQQQPYPAGDYFIHPSNLYVGDFGVMKVSPTVKLITPLEFQKFVQSMFKPLQAAA